MPLVAQGPHANWGHCKYTLSFNSIRQKLINKKHSSYLVLSIDIAIAIKYHMSQLMGRKLRSTLDLRTSFVHRAGFSLASDAICSRAILSAKSDFDKLSQNKAKGHYHRYTFKNKTKCPLWVPYECPKTHSLWLEADVRDLINWVCMQEITCRIHSWIKN